MATVATNSPEMETAPPAPDSAAEASQRIERLLDEVRAAAGPIAWRRVEELLEAVVSLYGRGLGRTLDLLAETGRLDEALGERLAADELVGSLLALHGIHPLPPEIRIRRALEAAAARLGRIDLVSWQDGVATLRAIAPARLPGLGAILERLVEEAAPEVATVKIDGVLPVSAPEPAAPLVQIDLARSRARTAG